MHYADLIGRLAVENLPCGGVQTVRYWVHSGGIDASSHVLDLACSTGFSIRTVSQWTGCTGCGLEISDEAVQSARGMMRRSGADLEIIRGDAECLPFDVGQFSHILAGSVFGFFRRPDSALRECARVLRPLGKLCTSTFFYHSSPPNSLLDKVERAAGFRPRTSWTKAYWAKFYSQEFELVASEDVELAPLDPADILSGCVELLGASSQACHYRESELAELVVDLFGRRVIFNEHSKYQSCVRAVWQKR